MVVCGVIIPIGYIEKQKLDFSCKGWYFYEYKPNSWCYNIYNNHKHSIDIKSNSQGVKRNQTDIGKKIS